MNRRSVRSGSARRDTSKSVRRGVVRNAGTPAWKIVAAAAAVLGLGAAAVFYQRTESTMAVDAQTLCPRDGGPAAMTAILIDATDQISPAQVRSLRQHVDAEIGNAEIGTQFTLGVVSDNPDQWGATAPLCKPRGLSDVSQINQNVRAVQKRYEEQFLTPISETFRQLTTTTNATQSPIMEALQALVAETPNFITFKGEKKLIIVSDLIQHSEAMSFYRGEDWQSFLHSPDASRLSETLSGADVTLFVLPRPHEKIEDPDAVEDFWARYLDRHGTHAPEVRRIGDL